MIIIVSSSSSRIAREPPTFGGGRGKADRRHASAGLGPKCRGLLQSGPNRSGQKQGWPAASR
eukprot:5291592-Pyramimonas_sp.AAC.1